jgi:hypothetical protein
VPSLPLADYLRLGEGQLFEYGGLLDLVAPYQVTKRLKKMQEPTRICATLRASSCSDSLLLVAVEQRFRRANLCRSEGDFI